MSFHYPIDVIDFRTKILFSADFMEDCLTKKKTTYRSFWYIIVTLVVHTGADVNIMGDIIFAWTNLISYNKLNYVLNFI